MKKFLKFLLLLLIWCGIAALVIVTTLYLGEPLMTAIWIIGAIFAVWLLFLILRKLIIRYRARKRVKALITEESPEAPEKGLFGRLRLPRRAPDDLTRRFHSFLKLLKRSRLKKLGDPLYVLPWFVIMGPEGSGKSAALNHARLPAPVFEPQDPEAGGCNWWPYNQGIVIDTPGTWVYPSDRDGRGQWLQLLRLLEKHHAKEPLNGLVIAMDAARLSDPSADDLFEIGRQHRARIDEMMNQLTISVPVYLLVTGCDRIHGFTAWAQTLPEEKRLQAMGYARTGEENLPQTFIPEAMDGMSERVKDLLLFRSDIDVQLLRLPGALKEMEEGLLIFTDGLFQVNPYQESPDLRGIYLSGILGTPTDQAAAEPGMKKDKGKGKGLFLQQFFTHVLPADRRISRVISRSERARIMTRRFAAGAWGIATLLSIFLLWWTYSGHADFLEEMTDKYKGSFSRGATFEQNLTTLAELREMTLVIDEEVKSWWMPWFGLGREPVFVTELRHLFAGRFRNDLLDPLDDSLTRKLDRGDLLRAEKKTAQPDDLSRRIAGYVGAIALRINLLQARLDGKGIEALKAMPRPFVEGDLFMKENSDPESVDLFNNLYLRAEVWTPSRATVEEELARLRTQLTRLLGVAQRDLSWLIPLANAEAPADDRFRLSSYWIGSKTLSPDVVIPGAYTLGGKAYIDNFIEQLIQTAPDSDDLLAMKQAFDEGYRKEYLAIWENFAQSFDRGMATLRGREEWERTIDLIATDRNPFFRLLDLLYEQVIPVAPEAAIPEWLALSDYFQEMLAYAPDDIADTSRGNKALSRLGLNALSKLGEIGRTASSTGRKAMITQRQVASDRSPDERRLVLEDAGKALGDYRRALMDIAFDARSRSVSYNAMAQFFKNPDQPTAGDTPLAKAYTAVRQLEALIGRSGGDARAFWAVYAGPIDVIRGYMLNEAACRIQELWENKFLVEIEGVPEYRRNSLMFGDEGKLWTFMDKHAGPFVTRAYGKGYVPARARGMTIPFQPQFLDFVSRGRDNIQTAQESYSVRIEALPTDANPDAAEIPSATILRLDCGETSQTLYNYNFTIEKTFEWTSQCGDALFSMEVGGVTLEKRYPGPKGFSDFLKDFRFGNRRFTPADFPEQEKKLSEMGIEYLDIKYRIEGHDELIRTKEILPAAVPGTIAVCWPPPPPDAQTGQRPKQPPKRSARARSSGQASVSRAEAEKRAYSVQIASFREESRATDLARKLREEGFDPAVYWLKDKRDRIWYTVHLGPYSEDRNTVQGQADQYNRGRKRQYGPRGFDPNLLEERKVDF